MDASRSRWEIIASHTFTYFNFLNLVLAGLILFSGQYKNDITIDPATGPFLAKSV